jgi:uncharacterized protein YprB with RNaseH-like and TPR domain
MTKEKFIELLKQKPYMMDMGAGKLSKQHGISREDVYNAKIIIRKNRIKLPKILLLDIETTPLEAYVWQMQIWKARINDDSVISRWFMLTWSAKWLFSGEVKSMRLTGKEVKKENDSRIVKGIWDMLNEADIVIAHNGDHFDVPNINTRFIVNGLSPTKPYLTIDTLRIAQKQFGFSHNSLNALARVFGLPEKIDTDFNLWKRCKDGEEDALIEMETYNKHDVEVLEEVYLKMRPWIKGHPNLALYMELDQPVCRNCGSKEIVHTGEHQYTSTGRYELMRCECGSYGRLRTTNYPKDKRKHILA